GTGLPLGGIHISHVLFYWADFGIRLTVSAMGFARHLLAVARVLRSRCRRLHAHRGSNRTSRRSRSTRRFIMTRLPRRRACWTATSSLTVNKCKPRADLSHPEGKRRRSVMSEVEHFDVLVFGSGVGGKLTAWTSAREGLRTAVVERRLIGGSCPNIACLPTKNVIHSAKVADFIRHDRDFGSGTAPASIEMAEVRARK